MQKKLTPKQLYANQSRLIKALRAAPLPDRWLCDDVMHLVAGLSARQHEKLVDALVDAIGKVPSAKKLGRYLGKMLDIKFERLVLERDLIKDKGYHLYMIHDRAESPDVLEVLITEKDQQHAQLDKWLSLPPSKQTKAFQAEHNRKARREREERKAADRHEQVELDAKLRADERAQLKTAAEAEKNCPQVWGAKSYMNQDDARRALERINFGGKVITQASNRYVLRWLLSPDPMKAHQDLLILLGLAKEHETALALDGLPIEVLLGKRLGAGASRDPRDYEDYSTRAAIRRFSYANIQNASDYAKRGNWSPFDV
jgi:hypothetical protein